MKSRHGMPRRAACGALIRRSAEARNDFPPGGAGPWPANPGPEAPCAAAPRLARSQHHHHLAPFHARLGFDLGVRLGIGLDPLQNLPAEFLVRQFTTAEPQRDLDLVAIVE